MILRRCYFEDGNKNFIIGFDVKSDALNVQFMLWKLFCYS